MVDLAVLQSVSYVAGAVGVLLAAINYILSTRNADKARQATLFMGIYEAYYSNDFRDSDYALFNIEMKNMDDWNRLVKDREMWNAFVQENLYLTGIGVLVRQNLIDIHFRLCENSLHFHKNACFKHKIGFSMVSYTK